MKVVGVVKMICIVESVRLTLISILKIESVYSLRYPEEVCVSRIRHIDGEGLRSA